MGRWRRGGFALAVLLWGCSDATDVGSDPAQQAPADAAADGARPAPTADAGGGQPDAAADAAPTAPDAAEPDAAAVEPDAEPDAAADARPDAAAVEPPPEVHGVDTRLGEPLTVAGLANRVTCEALDPDGVALPGVPTRHEVRPAEGWRADEDEGTVTGVRAGTYSVTCVADGLGLRDPTPARWDVLPGPAAAVYATADPPVVVAGSSAEVSCDATDAEGNPVDAFEAAIQVVPAGAGAQVFGPSVQFTVAGRYRIDCVLPGATSEGSATVTVVPGPPAALVAALVPDKPVYAIGEVVALVPTVTDAYGNAVEGAALTWSARPPLPSFGEGRFRPAAEGRYTLVVGADEPPLDGFPLEATAEILVDAGGPAVECTSPAEGAMLPLRALRLEGRVADVAGIGSLRVDGRAIPVGADGRFAADVQPAFGLNVHELVAVDAFGQENSTFCSYFAAPRYHPENAPLTDAVQLHLTPRAIDDGPPDRPLRSLTDLLRAVVNSPGLVQSIDQSLRAQNPVVPNECRQRVLGACILRLGAEYRGMRISGPNEMSISLVEGGLRVRAVIRGLALDVRLMGTLDNSGTISADHVLADLTFGVSLEGGRPRVRRISTNEVGVGGMDSDFDGFLSGALLDLVFFAFEGLIRDTVTDELRGFLEDQVDTLLADVLSGLDVSALGAELEIPSLSGGDPIRLGVGVGFSTLDADPQRLLAGLSTQVNGPVAEGAPSAGVPEPPGDRLAALRPQGTVGAAIAVSLLNQILHRLWRAGMFRIDDAGALLGGGDGASIGLRVQLPPAVEGTGQGVRLHFGPATGTVVLPELFDEPLRIRMAARGTAAVSLVEGSSIQFGDGRGGGIRIERLYLAIDGAPITAEARAALEARLVRLVQAVIDQSLNDALPALPIPDFELPASLAPYGIRPGTRLGLRAPTLTGTVSHWILDGEFRE